MDSQQIKPPEEIDQDIARARQIHDAMMRGNKEPLEAIITEHLGRFVKLAEKLVFQGIEPLDTVQSFVQKILLKGNIFNLYKGENNCSLLSFLLLALRRHIFTLNRKETERRSIETATDPAMVHQAEPEMIPRPQSPCKRRTAKNKHNKQVREFVYELLCAAIERKAAKIRLRFSKSGLTIFLQADGSEEAYSARPEKEKDIPQVIPRLKYIAGFSSDSSKRQTGSLTLTISSRAVFMRFASSTGGDGCETMEIHLNCHGEETDAPQLTGQHSQSSQTEDISEDEKEGDGHDGYDGVPQTTSKGDDDRAKPLDGFLEAVGWHTTNEGEDSGLVGIPGGFKSAGSSPVVENLEKQEAARRAAEIVKEALERLETTHPVDAKLIRLRMDEDNDFMAIAIELETDQTVRESYAEVKRILDTSGEKSFNSGQYKYLKDARANLKRRADTLKHQYERKDGPSSVFRYRVIVERLLVEKNMRLDRPDRPGKQLDERQLHELLAEAIGQMRAQGEDASVNIAMINLSLMRGTDIALLLGTIDGRNITKDTGKIPELKKLQTILTEMLRDKGCELTSLDGWPTMIQIVKKM